VTLAIEGICLKSPHTSSVYVIDILQSLG